MKASNPEQSLRYINRSTRRPMRKSLYVGAVLALSFGVGGLSLLAHSEVSGETDVDYNGTELAQLETLETLLPENLFFIEAIIFKRLDTSNANLSTATQTDASTAAKNTSEFDSREPLLLDAPRTLPANLQVLSKAQTFLGPKVNPETLLEPFGPAGEPECFNLEPEVVETPSSLVPLEMAVETGLDDLAILPALISETPPISETPLTTLDVMSMEIASEFSVSDTTAAIELFAAQATLLPVPRNRTTMSRTPYLELIGGLHAFSTSLNHNEFRQRSAENLALISEARRLERSGEFEVMAHLGWQQRVPARGRPQPIYLNLNNGELQGQLAVTLGRYLHTATTLWLTTPASGQTELKLTDARGYAQLDQTRRMRSGELHYFDHPLLGVLVRIERVEHPAELVSQFDAFKTQLQGE